MKAGNTPSYTDLIDDATQTLFDTSDTPRIDAEVLMQHIIKRPLAWLIAHGETIALAEHIKAFYGLITQRHSGHPVAYLVGHKDFWSLSLKVDNNVLIPRADTETLIEKALERLPQEASLDVLDLGTGSGAIALSISKERPFATVLAVDSQENALAIARENAITNNINNAVFLLSDWYSGLPDEKRFDLIASNPPYIEANDEHLQKGDLRFEPSSALVASDNGLADLTTIIVNAPSYLKKHGWLLVEHGFNQAREVAALFKTNGFENIECAKDINNLERCTLGQIA